MSRSKYIVIAALVAVPLAGSYFLWRAESAPLKGTLQPTIGKVFPMSEAAEAVRYLIEDRPFGRVLMHAQH